MTLPKKRKRVLLWWLLVPTLATYGVEHVFGIQGDETAKIASTARSGAIAAGAMEHNSSSTSGSNFSNMTTGQDYNEEGQQQRDISLCLLLIVRDEEESLQKNLPLWREVADCFVIGVDERTTDRTATTIYEVLGDDAARFVFFFTFQDFAQARNAVLRSTANNFPDCSHVIIADADWRPELETVDKSELDFVHGSFPFLVWDHSGHTSRLVGWLLRFDRDLRFKYRVHEVLDATATAASALPPKLVGWEVRVVESGSNWNTNLHQHSRSSERFLFDLDLLEKDHLEDPTDLHTLYYLGITTFAYLESLMGKGTHENTPELQALVTSGMSYLGQAVDLHGDVKNSEFVWGSKRWLAYGYHFFIGDGEKAEAAYEACFDYDPARVDCVVFLSRLYLANGDIDAAWEKAQMALLHRPAVGDVLAYFYTFECFVPAQAAAVITKRIISGSGDFGNDSLEGLLTLGSYLVRHHRDVCHHGVMVDSPEDIARLGSWFDEAIERQGIDVEEIRRAASDESASDSLLALLLRTWGTGMKASSAWHQQAQQQQQQQQQQQEQQELDMAADELVQPSSSPHTTDYSSENQQQQHQGESTPATAPFTPESCAEIVGEARARMELGVQTAPGTLVPTRLDDVNAVLGTRLAGGGPIRAMILGGAGGRTADDDDDDDDDAGGDFDHEEELLRVVSLMLQLSSSPARSELTYASPESSAVEAARSVASSCATEIGIADGRVRVDFVRSTLGDFLRSPALDQQQLDYVDVGGPLSWNRAAGRNGNDGDNTGVKPAAAAADHADASEEGAVLDSEALKLLGPKLAPGGCLRAWAFASNPFTELVFRAAAKMTAAGSSSSSLSAPAISSLEQTSGNGVAVQAESNLVGKVLRTTFGAGQRQQQQQQYDAMPILVTGEDGDDEEWVRHAASKVLAGGDRLSVANIDEVLASGGFDLALRLGRGDNATTEQLGGLAPAGAAYLTGMMEEELVEGGGMSRWEVADFADSLEATPKLVHQILAVWRGGGGDGSSVALPQ